MKIGNKYGSCLLFKYEKTTKTSKMEKFNNQSCLLRQLLPGAEVYFIVGWFEWFWVIMDETQQFQTYKACNLTNRSPGYPRADIIPTWLGLHLQNMHLSTWFSIQPQLIYIILPFHHWFHNKCFEAASRIIDNYVKCRNRGPSTSSIEQNTPYCIKSTVHGCWTKTPLRLVFGLNLMGYFGGSVSPGPVTSSKVCWQNQHRQTDCH